MINNTLISSMFNVRAILQAFAKLAGRCDGAASHDGVGFKKNHAVYNNDFVASMVTLAERPTANLSPKQAMAAIRVLSTYKKTQLVQEWPEIWTVQNLVLPYTLRQTETGYTMTIDKNAIPQELIESRDINCAMTFFAKDMEGLTRTVKQTLNQYGLSGTLKATEIILLVATV